MLKFDHILFVAVPDAHDDATLERVLRLAEAHEARLTIADLRPAIDARAAGVPRERLRAALAAESEATLAPYVEAARGRVEVDTCTLYGIGFVEVIRTVLRGGHDLVVKTAHGRRAGTGGALGSLDRHLLRKCPAPVWIDGPRTTEHYRRVLAAVDIDPATAEPASDSLNRRILDAAAAQALADFAELHVVHVWQPAYEGILRSRGVFRSEDEAAGYVERERRSHQEGLDRLGARLREWLGAETHDYLRPQLHLRRGTADETIPATVEEVDADLLVMGTVGRTGIAGLIIGNTAETILDGIDRSVLAVKPPGFRTPVAASD